MVQQKKQHKEKQQSAAPVRAAKHRRTGARAKQKTAQRETAATRTLDCRMVRVSGGYGFAAPLDDAEAEKGDIFIPGRELHGVLPGEEVQVTLAAHPRRIGSREGVVTQIADGVPTVTGVLESLHGWLWLRPDFDPEQLLAVERGSVGPACAGQKVAAALVSRGADYDRHRFAVTACFGDAESAAACSAAVLYREGIPTDFEEKTCAAAEILRQQAGALSVLQPGCGAAHFPSEELAARTDLRQQAAFTIDSAHTKDRDDALYIVPDGDGWQLDVHIADVSHYVRPYSAPDKEALVRGASVYYADQVVPMLPPALSNDLCSLNAGVERLTLSCRMRLDADGAVTAFRFEKTVIRSRVKGVYEEIDRLYAGEDDPALTEKYAAVASQLPQLRALYEKLAAKRAARGGMDIESGESKLITDENGRCVAVEKRQRGLSGAIIEECMILANGCAARLLRERQLPGVYRIHTAPTPDRVETLKTTLGALGVPFRFAGGTPTQPELSALLDASRGTRLENAVHTAVLRTMAKARYEPQPLGHYGLALADYAHFTSPIRRYPDLAVHRILSEYIGGQDADYCRRRYAAFAAQAAAASSVRELAILTAERACEDCYKAEAMRPLRGQCFDGTVSGVTAYGVYVRLENTVEGLLHAAQLGIIAPQTTEGVALTDLATGRRWTVGDAVRVRLAAVSVPLGQVDFALAAQF